MLTGALPEPTLYLFDGYNLLHAGEFTGPSELVDALASFVALRGARGVVVFDGAGEDRDIGPLSIRHATHADDLLERLAAENRGREAVVVVTSDSAVRGTAGQEVRKRGSRSFLADLERPGHHDHEQTGAGGRVGDRLDLETRERLERLRRGE
jgi:predicted RNA-binding protein with PIN domain